MANLFFQGKLIRQFWGKINRQSTKRCTKFILAPVYNVLPGGGQFSKYLSNKITFFCSVKRIE